jgi:hypothetical protein
MWEVGESLTDVLAALGMKSERTEMGRTVKRGDVEVFSSTHSNAYELCVLWLLRTRQVALTSRLERVVYGYSRYGLGEEIDQAMASARGEAANG